MRDKGYEHELTLNDGEVYYVVSTTFYINKEDREYLVEQTIDLNEVESVKSYKLSGKFVPQRKHEDLLGAMEAQTEGHDVKDVQVIIDGHRYKVI